MYREATGSSKVQFPKAMVERLNLSRSQIKGLEDKVERSNYDYSKLKKREREESYSKRFC